MEKNTKLLIYFSKPQYQHKDICEIFDTLPTWMQEMDRSSPMLRQTEQQLLQVRKLQALYPSIHDLHRSLAFLSELL